MRISGSMTEWAVTSGIAIVAAGALLVRCFGDQPEVGRNAGTEVELNVVPGAPTQSELAGWYSTGHVIGPEWAPVQIVEFGNFTCEYCRQFYHSLDTIQQRYPGLVSVRWLHHVPSDLNEAGVTTRLAIAAECAAAQIPFATFYNALFKADRVPSSKIEVLSFAKSVGVPDGNGFAACLDSAAPVARLAEHTEARLSRQFTVTPTWFANKHLFVGAPPTSTLDSIVLSLMDR